MAVLTSIPVTPTGYASLSAQTIGGAGTSVALSVANDGCLLLHMRNTAAYAQKITIQTAYVNRAFVDGVMDVTEAPLLTSDGLTIAIPANGTVTAGPFDPTMYNQGDGTMHGTLTVVDVGGRCDAIQFYPVEFIPSQGITE